MGGVLPGNSMVGPPVPCESADMANDEARGRAAEVNEQFRPVELSAETVTRPAGSQSRTVQSFLRHSREKGLDCVPEPLALNEETAESFPRCPPAPALL